MKKEMIHIDYEYVGYTFDGTEAEEEIQKIKKDLSKLDDKIKRKRTRETL